MTAGLTWVRAAGLCTVGQYCVKAWKYLLCLFPLILRNIWTPLADPLAGGQGRISDFEDPRHTLVAESQNIFPEGVLNLPGPVEQVRIQLRMNLALGGLAALTAICCLLGSLAAK